MRVKERYLTSSTRMDQLYVKTWLPDTEPEIIVQIAHGMIEHIGRYEAFAAYLCERGIAVVANDHLGHGKTAASPQQYGYFANQDGDLAVLADLHRVSKWIKKQYPNCPLVLLGHSMGSFFSRWYITRFGRQVDAVILSGTGFYSVPQATAGKLLSRLIMMFYGEFYRSRLLYQMSIGTFEKSFKTDECKCWVTSDKEEAEVYEEDPLCHFLFTASAYHDMFKVLQRLAKKKGISKIPKNLPILLISGKMDAVGDFGKGVKKVYQGYKEAGLRNIHMKLYDGDRHEILHETNRIEVYDDMIDWIRQEV